MIMPEGWIKTRSGWFNRNIARDLSTTWIFVAKDTHGYKVWGHGYDQDFGVVRNVSKKKAMEAAIKYMREHPRG